MPDRKPHLSSSSIQMLFRCGEQYRRRYVDGDKMPPGVAMLIGRGVDQSVDANLQNVINIGFPMSGHMVENIARDAIVREWESGEVSLTDEERYIGSQKIKGAAIDDTVALAMKHYSVVAPQIEPASVQKFWRVELKNFPFDLVGRIDIEETSGTVRDTKTSIKSPSEEEADRSLQLSFYSLKRKVVDGAFPNKLTLDYLVRRKSGPKVVIQETVRDQQDMEILLRRVEVAAEAIESQRFLPTNESNWWCSKTWCGFYGSCPYVRGKARPKS